MLASAIGTSCAGIRRQTPSMRTVPTVKVLLDDMQNMRSLEIGSVQLNLARQFFRNVVRPPKGTAHDLRFLVELSF